MGDIAGLAPGVAAEAVGGIGVTVLAGIFLAPEMMSVYILYWLAQSYALDGASGWLRQSIIRYLPGNPGYFPAFARHGLALVLGTSLLLALAGAALTSFFPETAIGLYYYLTLCALAGGMAFHLLQSFARAMFMNRAFSRGAMALATMKLVFAAIFLSAMDDKVAAILGSMALSFIVASAMQGAALFMNTPARASSAPVEAEGLLNKSLRYGVPMAISGFSLNFLRTGDRYLLAGFVSMKDLGAYAYWVALGFQAGATLQSLIFMAANPRVFELYENDQSAGKRFMGTFSTAYIALAIPLFVIVGFVTPPVLSFAKIRAEYLDAAWLVFFGLYSAFMAGLAQIHGKNSEFEGTTGAYVKASAIGIAVMAVAVIWLAGAMGVLGGAVASAIGFTVYFAVVAHISRSWPSVRGVLLGIAGGALASVICLGLRSFF
jgi:O-antigen/teichoic acid export membrane protein